MLTTRIAWLVVLLHALIATIHGVSHLRLDISLSALQSAYVLLVITIAPILAAVLLRTRWARTGFGLLALSMAGSLFFGVYWHYVAQSPDNVFQLHEGTLQSLFRSTALLLAMSEACGVVVGLGGVLKDQKP